MNLNIRSNVVRGINPSVPAPQGLRLQLAIRRIQNALYKRLEWISMLHQFGIEALFMRTAVVLLVLPLSACAGAYATPSDGRLATRINKTYAARDACLANNVAAENTGNADAASVARAVAQACLPETEKLVEVSNRDGDPRVANAIRKDSEFRAMGYVLKARNQVTD